MANQHLLIVESPAKAKTINKYLGKDFSVLASYGHVRDLRPKEGAVDPEQDFQMHYEIIDRNQKHVDAITKAMKKADCLYLATDPDREGEAIAWHVAELLEEKGLLKDKPVRRVVFYEITQRAVREALDNARDLSTDLINAQQARRALDYLVGFNLSPVLWKQTATRQLVRRAACSRSALRLIVCARGRNRRPSSPRGSIGRVEADFAQGRTARSFDRAPDHSLDGAKLEQVRASATRRRRPARVSRRLRRIRRRHVCSRSSNVERKQVPAQPGSRPSSPRPCSRRPRASSASTRSHTMRDRPAVFMKASISAAARSGLITYMRTDSVSPWPSVATERDRART